MGMDSFILTDISRKNLEVTDSYLMYWRRNYTLNELMEGIFYQRGGYGDMINRPIPLTIENLHWLRDRLSDDDVAYGEWDNTHAVYAERRDFFERLEEMINNGSDIYYYVSY